LKITLLLILFLFLNVGTVLAQAADTTTSDTIKVASEPIEEKYSIDPVDSALIADIIMPQPTKYSPRKAVLFSTLLPGSGQFYSRRKSRGVVFLAAEGIIGGLALGQRNSWHKKLKEYKKIEPDIDIYFNTFTNYLIQNNTDSAYTYLSLYNKADNSYLSKRYDAYDEKFDYYTFVGWGIGIYITNIFDALSSSKHFYSEERKKPGLAAGLSAIPVLGLGQFYNGSYQKAGVLWTTEVMLLFMAINKWRLAETANKKVFEISENLLLTETERAEFSDGWSDKYDDALQKRNSYLWYFVLFYFYGIFDAAVDAHLHDKALKIRLQPKADPIEKSASLNLSLNIKSRKKAWQ